jgi:hypothetical protein
MTVLMALSTIVVEQTKVTEKTMVKCSQLLDYLAYHADAIVRFYTSNMIMNIHSDILYILEANTQSQTCGHFFMGWMPKNGHPIKLNGAFHVSANVIYFVVASDVEAKLGALFHNYQTGIIFCSILKDMGHAQPQTPVHCNNATAVGIANSTVKRQQLQSTEMQLFGISDKCAQDMYALHWHLIQENLVNYQGKHHAGAHHVAVRPWYLHIGNSLGVLPRAQAPSTLKECVRTLDDRYIREVPLPRAPRIQSAAHVTSDATRDLHAICYLQVPRIPTRSDLVRSHVGCARSMMLHLAPCWLM